MEVYALLEKAMDYNLCKAVCDEMKQRYNIEIDKNVTYNLGDLEDAIKSLVDEGYRVRVLKELFKNGSDKYKGMSSLE